MLNQTKTKPPSNSRQQKKPISRIADLSFVAARDGVTLPKPKRGQLPYCFWNVQPSGKYDEDCRTGYRLAIEYLELEEKEPSSGHLQLIVGDMPRPLSGIEIGFLTIVSYSAGAGADEGRRVVAYWEKCREADGNENAPA